MEEITRFFGSLFRRIVYSFKYKIIDATERQVETTFNRQFDRLQKPKQQEQAEDDRK